MASAQVQLILAQALFCEKNVMGLWLMENATVQLGTNLSRSSHS